MKNDPKPDAYGGGCSKESHRDLLQKHCPSGLENIFLLVHPAFSVVGRRAKADRGLLDN